VSDDERLQLEKLRAMITDQNRRKTETLKLISANGHSRHVRTWTVSGTSGFGRENAVSDIRFASPPG
jgi:hypothetical protein